MPGRSTVMSDHRGGGPAGEEALYKASSTASGALPGTSQSSAREDGRWSGWAMVGTPLGLDETVSARKSVICGKGEQASTPASNCCFFGAGCSLDSDAGAVPLADRLGFALDRVHTVRNDEEARHCCERAAWEWDAQHCETLVGAGSLGRAAGTSALVAVVLRLGQGGSSPSEAQRRSPLSSCPRPPGLFGRNYEHQPATGNKLKPAGRHVMLLALGFLKSTAPISFVSPRSQAIAASENRPP